MTIKKTAGKVLLFLYREWTENPISLSHSVLTFENILFSPMSLKTENNYFAEAMRQITPENEGASIYASLSYLLDKKMIHYSSSHTLDEEITLWGFHLTDSGIDVIEGVEQGREPQKILKSLFSFNFNFTPKMKIESLIKAEVGNIVGIGGAVNAKMKNTLS